MISKNLIESSYLARYIFLNSVDISDYKIFPSRDIQNSPPVFHFLPSENVDALLLVLNQVAPTNIKGQRAESIDQFLEYNGTVAFLVIKDDKLLFERYYNGYGHSSICTSFSTVKSFVSALIGIAAHERLIHQLDDPITKYLPELLAPYWSAITIRHLVSMSSGLKYNAHGFFPWNDQPRIYYTPDIRQLARQARKIEPPGVHFLYNNFNWSCSA
jgi:CubicO group peptidase (beta-lactamase class C family)